MTENQKIYPVHHDLEAPPIPTAPLVPNGTPKSDHNDQTKQPALPTNKTQDKPPKKRRGCLCKCLLWTILLLILMIIIIGILAAVVYFVYQPKIPKYSVDSLRVTQFNLADESLYATFNVNITLRNPNKRIGIYYGKGSDIKGFYNGTQLCQGSLPSFYQGHRNTTILDIPLTGQTDNATSLLQSLQIQQATGSVPINLKAKVPVRIKLGSLKLMTLKFHVKCNLVVNSLSTNNNISLRSSDCKFKLRL